MPKNIGTLLEGAAMLNKKVCEQCRFRGASDFGFSFLWDKHGVVDCLRLFVDKARYLGSISVLNNPPEKCPYILEHAVCQESVNK